VKDIIFLCRFSRLFRSKVNWGFCFDGYDWRRSLAIAYRLEAAAWLGARPSLGMPSSGRRAPTQPLSPLQRQQLQILLRHPGHDDAPDTDDHGQPSFLAQFAIDACTTIAGDYADIGG
jgi:hypothetical protein